MCGLNVTNDKRKFVREIYHQKGVKEQKTLFFTSN